MPRYDEWILTLQMPIRSSWRRWTRFTHMQRDNCLAVIALPVSRTIAFGCGYANTYQTRHLPAPSCRP